MRNPRKVERDMKGEGGLVQNSPTQRVLFYPIIFV